MEIARIEGNAVIERREMSLSDVPEHKRAAWRPVEGENPSHDPRIETITGPTYTIEPTRVLRTWVVTPRDLVAVKSDLTRRVDDDAEAVRMRYLTPGSGMAMVYQEKFAQAQAVNAMGETAANAMSQLDRDAQFPTLSASVGLEAPSLWGCAQLVLGKYAAFAALSLGIERSRLTAKSQIAAASTVQSVRDAYEAIAWPTP